MPFPIASSIGDARKAIEARVHTWWTSDEAQAATAIAWQNVDFTAPTNAVWLQVGIQMGESAPASFGVTGQNKRIGVLFLTIYAPRGGGSAQLDALAARALAKFTRQIAGAVEYQETSGPVDIGDPAWATAQITIRFQIWETVTPGVTA